MDFITVAVLLLSAGLAYEFIVKKAHSNKSRIILAIVLVVVILSVWAELAVGLFNTPFSGS